MTNFGERQFRFASVVAISISLSMLIGYFHGKGFVFYKIGGIKTERNVSAAGAESAPQTIIASDTIDAGTLTRKLKAKPIDINSADREELMKLPGIGRTLAKRILIYRAKKGKFKSTDELINVKGIGKKNLKNVKKLAIVK